MDEFGQVGIVVKYHFAPLWFGKKALILQNP